MRPLRRQGHPTGRLERRRAGPRQPVARPRPQAGHVRGAEGRHRPHPGAWASRWCCSPSSPGPTAPRERFRKDLVRLAVKDPYGDYYHYGGYQYQTATQLLDINTTRLIPMCFLSEEYLQVCEEEFQKMVDLGADGILFDECLHHTPGAALLRRRPRPSLRRAGLRQRPRADPSLRPPPAAGQSRTSCSPARPATTGSSRPTSSPITAVGQAAHPALALHAARRSRS